MWEHCSQEKILFVLHSSDTVKTSSKVMMWGAIKSFMSIRNCDKFVHDCAPCYRTKTVKDWFEQQENNLIGPWTSIPSKIVGDWSKERSLPEVLPRRLHWSMQSNMCGSPRFQRAFWNALLNPSIDGLATRIQAYLQANGWHTKYKVEHRPNYVGYCEIYHSIRTLIY